MVCTVGQGRCEMSHYGLCSESGRCEMSHYGLCSGLEL